MNILIDLLMWLVILVPIVITVISYMVYSNIKSESKIEKKLLCLTVPNFMFSILLPTMLSIFTAYGLNSADAFEIFFNGLANGKIYSWLLLSLIVCQISVTCINGVYLAKDISKQNSEKKTNEQKNNNTLKLSKAYKIILICIIIFFLVALITDICMLESERNPIFCIQMGAYLDGGTKVYLGFGYKIIDYNKIDGFNGYKIGTWFMQYDNLL